GKKRPPFSSGIASRWSGRCPFSRRPRKRRRGAPGGAFGPPEVRSRRTGWRSRPAPPPEALRDPDVLRNTALVPLAGVSERGGGIASVPVLVAPQRQLRTLTPCRPGARRARTGATNQCG